MARSGFTLLASAVVGLAALGGIGLALRTRAPRILAAGAFHQVAHKGAGWAQLAELPDGRRVLRLLELRTAYRPDLEVYLISAADAPENETVKRAERVSLGPLLTTGGDQELAVPAGLDLTRFHAVTIWSDRYQVNFTTAPLVWSAEP